MIFPIRKFDNPLISDYNSNILKPIKPSPVKTNVEIENLAPKEITVGTTKSKKEIEELAQYFKQIKNNIDGRVAEFPKNTIGKNKIHSTAISDITVYKNGDGSQRIRVMYPGEANSSPFYDLRLAEFLNSVKENVSKIADKNGKTSGRQIMYDLKR